MRNKVILAKIQRRQRPEENSYMYLEQDSKRHNYHVQRAKKVLSDSLGLVGFDVGLVNNRRTVKSILLVKKFLGLVGMMSGLVNNSFSLPEWQAVKMIFFAPWFQSTITASYMYNLFISHFIYKMVIIFYPWTLFNQRRESQIKTSEDTLSCRQGPNLGVHYTKVSILQKYKVWNHEERVDCI